MAAAETYLCLATAVLTLCPILCTAVNAAAGLRFSCLAAVTVKNLGNVPMSFTGLEAQATTADGSPCSSQSLAPMTSLTCDLTWNASAAESEAGLATITLQAIAKTVGVVTANATVWTGAAVLPVQQIPRMAAALEQVAPATHSSNGKGMHRLAPLPISDASYSKLPNLKPPPQVKQNSGISV